MKAKYLKQSKPLPLTGSTTLSTSPDTRALSSSIKKRRMRPNQDGHLCLVLRGGGRVMSMEVVGAEEHTKLVEGIMALLRDREEGV